MEHSLIIRHNLLRLLSMSFMHIEPRRHSATILREGGKYNVESPTYGRIGQVELLKVWERQMYDLRDTETLLSIGYSAERSKEILKAEGVVNLGAVQCGVFRFLRRDDEVIKTLLDTELPKHGITIIRQGALIS